MPPQYALIADDLTGALDAGAGFAAAGLRAALPLSNLPEAVPDADVVLINTASREVTASAAATATRDAAERLRSAGIERVYKKMDSVLRGHPGPELAAVLDVYRGRALVAPAFPAQGRITRGGVQYVHGQPAAPFGGFLRDALETAATRSDIRDAETDDDLARIAADVSRNPAYRVWCGTAGLAKHVPAALGLTSGGPLPQLPRSERVLVIAGTDHPATTTQLEVLRAAALANVEIRFRPALPIAVAPSTALILTGGETALRACQALNASSIEVLGEALPGIPVAALKLPNVVVPIATKSGGFGAPDALVRTAERLLAKD